MKLPEVDYDELKTIINSPVTTAEDKITLVMKYRDKMWLRAIGFGETPNDYFVQEVIHKFLKELGIAINDSDDKYLY